MMLKPSVWEVTAVNKAAKPVKAAAKRVNMTMVAGCCVNRTEARQGNLEGTVAVITPASAEPYALDADRLRKT
jgi:hypothetical protein